MCYDYFFEKNRYRRGINGKGNRIHTGNLRYVSYRSSEPDQKPIVPLEERAEIVRSIKYVDEVIITNTLDKKEIWDKIRFDEIYIGDDWKGNERWERTGKEMEALGARLVYLPYTKDTSSTMLREKLKEY